jgi:hypothetical protein
MTGTSKPSSAQRSRAMKVGLERQGKTMHHSIQRLAVALLLAGSALTVDAQSGASPFAKPPPGQLAAISAWDKLPAVLRARIAEQLGPLSEAQRIALLSSQPGLKNLSPQQLTTILAYVEALHPTTPVIDQAFMTGFYSFLPINVGDFSHVYQTYTAGITGKLTKVSVQAQTFGNVGTLEVRESLGGLVLATGQIQNGNDAGEVDVVLSAAVPQTAGIEYVLVVHSPGTYYLGISQPTYAGGEAGYQRGSLPVWYPASWDVAFKTFVVPAN